MSMTPTAGSRSFVKMHGLGNDFAIFDARRQPIWLVAEQVRLLSNRRLGIGCDQLIVMEPSEKADVFMRIFNADGSEVSACGNATRCVAALMFAEGPRHDVHIETRAGLIRAETAAGGAIRVDMGEPGLTWRDIPLRAEMDTLTLPIREGVLINPTAVSMGNPHAVFFVDDADAVDLAVLGPTLEHHPLFPERANISVAEVVDQDHIRLHVWERGAGLTLACGTAACAVAVAAVRRGLTARLVQVRLPGGTLEIEWSDQGRVLMTGPVAVAFMGLIEIPEIAGVEAVS